MEPFLLSSENTFLQEEFIPNVSVLYAHHNSITLVQPHLTRVSHLMCAQRVVLWKMFPHPL